MLLTGRAFSPRKVKSRLASRCWLSLYAQLWVENRSGSCRSALRSFGEEMASQALFLLFQAKVQKELSGLGKWAGREWGEEPDNLLYNPEVKIKGGSLTQAGVSCVWKWKRQRKLGLDRLL